MMPQEAIRILQDRGVTVIHLGWDAWHVSIPWLALPELQKRALSDEQLIRLAQAITSSDCDPLGFARFLNHFRREFLD